MGNCNITTENILEKIRGSKIFILTSCRLQTLITKTLIRADHDNAVFTLIYKIFAEILEGV